MATSSTANPWVTAVSIEGEKVLAVGTDAALTATADKHTRIVDLHGRMAMPGINDAHDHVGGAPFGVEAHTQTLPPANPSIDEVADAVHAAALTAASGEWIVCDVGRELIDKLGIKDDVKDIDGGRYDRDADGHLTGLLEENTGNAIRQRLSSQAGVTPAEIAELRAYAQHRLEQGVTTVQVMASNQKLSDLEKAFVQANTPLRLRIMRFPFPEEDALNHEQLGSGEQQLTPLIRVAGVKWVLDGTPHDGELAFQTTDYPDRPGWRGRPNFSVDFIDSQLKIALTGKDQLMMHIVGDAMTDEVLAEMQKLAPAERWRPLRVRFEHGDGFTTPARMELARQYGIVIAQPRPGRPFHALTAAGIPLAYGSDGGMAPFFMFGIMTQPGNPQSISREQALSILTAGPAHAEFEEKTKGTLAPGMLADLAVLSQDVMTATPDKLPSTHSVMTIVGGKIAYTSPEFEAK